MSTKVGTKGQVVIEKSIRDRLGIEPGYVAVQHAVEDRVEIHFFPPDHERSLRGTLAGETKAKVSPDGAAWEEALDEAWRQASVVAEGGASEDE